MQEIPGGRPVQGPVGAQKAKVHSLKQHRECWGGASKEGVFFHQGEKGHSRRRDEQAKGQDKKSQMHWGNWT